MSIKSINQKALKIFNQTGFPHQKNEYWKHTNLKKISLILLNNTLILIKTTK